MIKALKWLIGASIFALGLGTVVPFGQAAPNILPQEHSATSVPVTALATVKRVIDGDTFKTVEGEDIRLLSVDTPEVVDPKRPVGCYGPEASAEMKRLLPAGTQVRLEDDKQRLDPYRRHLAIVTRVSDGLVINEYLLINGFAKTMFVPPNLSQTIEYSSLAAKAKDAGRGLWSACL